MDPLALTTLDRVLAAMMKAAEIPGMPWWAAPAIVVLVVSFFGLRAASAISKPPAPPVSDGGTAADRALPPAKVVAGEPGGGPTGGMGA